MSKDELTKIAESIGLAMQQSRDKEVSGLFKEIKTDIALFRKDFEGAVDKMNSRFDQVEEDVSELENYLTNEISPNVYKWNNTSETYVSDKTWVIRLILGIVITAVIGLILVQ